MRKAELFDRYFSCTSWHHTSKFFNATDFYSVDGLMLDEECAPLPQRDAIAMESCRLAAVEETALRNADAHRMCAARDDDARRLTVAAFAAMFAQCVKKRVTKRGNVMYSLNEQGHSTFPGLEWNNERFGENLLWGLAVPADSGNGVRSRNPTPTAVALAAKEAARSSVVRLGPSGTSRNKKGARQ